MNTCQPSSPRFYPGSPTIYVNVCICVHVYTFVYVHVYLTLVHMCVHLFTLYLSNFDQARRMGVADNLLRAADGFVASPDYANQKDAVVMVMFIECSIFKSLKNTKET